MTQIVELLSSPGAEQRDVSHLTLIISSSTDYMYQTAGRTIAELCRKLGERILNDMIPLLKAGAQSPNPRNREGICLALSQIVYVKTSRFASLRHSMPLQGEHNRRPTRGPRGRYHRHGPTIPG